MGFDVYPILIAFSLIIIFAFLYDNISHKVKIPSILFLIFTGVGIGYLANQLDITINRLTDLLPLMGTIALVLIVFEASLELKFKKKSKVRILKAFALSSLGILLTSFGLAFIFREIFNISFYDSLIIATPFSVISSAVAIPAAAKLTAGRKEFVVYESTFSDIIGVVFFNFLVINKEFSAESFARLGYDIVLITILAIIASVVMVLLIQEINSKVKLSFVLACLLLVYSISRILHLPALLVVMMFGILLSNISRIDNSFIRRRLKHLRLEVDTDRLLSLTAELAFVARAVLFIIFGISIQISGLIDWNVINYGMIILLVAVLVRLILLYILRVPTFPSLFFAPRGLITILLFISIPSAILVPEISTGVLVFVVLVSCLVMPFGVKKAHIYDENQSHIDGMVSGVDNDDFTDDPNNQETNDSKV